jgi:mRNA interferase MazF
MAYSRGDVVLIPFPFTDLSTAKTRPAAVISGAAYHNVRSELLLAYISSQVSKAHPILDHMLIDWASAGLPRPSFVRPKVAAIEPSLIVHRVGTLSSGDLFEVGRRLWHAFDLPDATIELLIHDMDLSMQPEARLQSLAEKLLAAIMDLDGAHVAGVDVARLRMLLTPRSDLTA